jgi:hypothetical protein
LLLFCLLFGIGANTNPTPAVVAGDCVAVCIQPLSRTAVPKWDKLELMLDVKRQVHNPYDPNDIDLQVRFIGPDGRAAHIPAFFDGAIWRARFTPTIQGAWSAMAILRDRVPIESTPVQFMVDAPPPNAHGFVRVDKRNSHYLVFDDGTPFFAIGLNLAWWKDDPIADYTRWMDALAANGGNTIRIWMAPWSFSLEWNDTPLGNYTKRMRRAELLDKVFTLAEARGIHIQLVLLNHGQFSETQNAQWHENPFNIKNGGFLNKPIEFATDARAKQLFKQRLRYIAARWGYSPNLLAWEWWNEVNFTPIVQTKVHKAWIEEMTPALMQHDPNDHLLTTSYSIEGDADIWNMPQIDLVQRHEYRATDPKWFRPFVTNAKATTGVGRFEQQRGLLPKPLIMGEWGASPEREAANAATRYGVALHNGLWAAPFAGMASTAMYWWWDWLVDPANLWPHFKGIAEFMRGEDLATLNLIDAKASRTEAIAMALGNKRRTLVWLRNRAYNHDDVRFKYQIGLLTGETTEQAFRFEPPVLSDVRVFVSDMEDGDYVVTWFDTLTGLPVRREQAASRAGKLDVVAPMFNRDLAAKIAPS